MAWNEPGDSNKNNDPWGKNRGGSDTPPDLDQMIKNMQKKLSGLLGGTAKGDGGSDDNPGESLTGVWVILGVIFAIWLVAGFYIVKPAEKAVVLRFGRYIETVGDGPHWAPRFIDTVYKIDEQKISSYAYQANMLTKDENIVSVSIAIQYRIDSAKDFLFNIVGPENSLREATASALRQVIGNTTLDAVLTYGREDVREQVLVQLRDILDRYQAGFAIVDVALQPAKAPDQVREAFDNAIKAEQEKEQIINVARAYREQVLPKAQGKEKRLLANANAYQREVVLNAEGETARYLALLPQYQKSPQVTRERLYLATLESVLSHTSKVFMDIDKGNKNNLFVYLPLEKLLAQSGANKRQVTRLETDQINTQVSVPMASSSANLANTGGKQGGYLNFSSNNTSRGF